MLEPDLAAAALAAQARAAPAQAAPAQAAPAQAAPVALRLAATRAPTVASIAAAPNASTSRTTSRTAANAASIALRTASRLTASKANAGTSRIAGPTNPAPVATVVGSNAVISASSAATSRAPSREAQRVRHPPKRGPVLWAVSTALAPRPAPSSRLPPASGRSPISRSAIWFTACTRAISVRYRSWLRIEN